MIPRRPRPPRIEPYLSYGTPDRVYVRGRVLSDPALRPAGGADPWWRNLARFIRRMANHEVADARVTARFSGSESRVTTDSEGHYRTWIVPGHAPAPSALWHPVDVEARDEAGGGRSARASGRVLVPDPAARFGVISDVDDTVLRTKVASLARMAAEVAFGNVHTRTPFPGVAPLFRALHRREGRPRPVFYVSNGPWNLHDVVTEFLELRGFPLGPVDLRDWDLRSVMDGQAKRAHKLGAIRRIFQTLASLPFILIGDSGEEDPEIYHRIVHEHPSRVLAVYIRDVSPDAHRDQEIESLAAEVTAAGSSLVLAEDSRAVARHAADHGWIAPGAVGPIAAECGAGGEAVVVEDGSERSVG